MGRDTRIDLGQMIAVHRRHILLEPPGNLGPIESELPPHLLARDLTPLGHTLQPTRIGADHPGQVLQSHTSVGHVRSVPS